MDDIIAVFTKFPKIQVADMYDSITINSAILWALEISFLMVDS